MGTIKINDCMYQTKSLVHGGIEKPLCDKICGVCPNEVHACEWYKSDGSNVLEISPLEEMLSNGGLKDSSEIIDLKGEFIIDSVINKNTNREVCKEYTKRRLSKLGCTKDYCLKLRYLSGGFFTHEAVVSVKELEYGFQIETTRKYWKFIKVPIEC